MHYLFLRPVHISVRCVVMLRVLVFYFLVNIGMLLVFGSFFAWQTRKIQIEELNDSKHIGNYRQYLSLQDQCIILHNSGHYKTMSE